jgi:hypothetical protein
MNETATNALNELVTSLKSAFEDLAKEMLADAQGDVKAYAAQLAQEYGKYLWRSYKDKDADAARNLDHLKAQVALLAVKREIVVARESVEALKAAIGTAAKIGARVLLSLAVAAL